MVLVHGGPCVVPCDRAIFVAGEVHGVSVDGRRLFDEKVEVVFSWRPIGGEVGEQSTQFVALQLAILVKIILLEPRLHLGLELRLALRLLVAKLR